jgi:hypothetical protein
MHLHRAAVKGITDQKDLEVIALRVPIHTRVSQVD